MDACRAPCDLGVLLREDREERAHLTTTNALPPPFRAALAAHAPPPGRPVMLLCVLEPHACAARPIACAMVRASESCKAERWVARCVASACCGREFDRSAVFLGCFYGGCFAS